MKRLFCRFTVTATVTAAIAASLLFLPKAHGEIVNGIAVKVGNTVITVNEFNRAYNTAKKQALLLGSEAPLKKDVMNKLIDDALVKIESERRGIIVTEEEVNGIIDNIKKQNAFNDEQMKEQLALEGLTLKDLKAQYTREIMKARLINLMGAERNAEVSEGSLKEFYNDPANRDLLSIPGTGTVRLSRIVIPVPANATYKEALDVKNKVTGIYDQAKRGEDFQSLVQAYSSAPGKSGNGGPEGTFTQEQLLALFPRETVALIYSLEQGDVAPPMRVNEGYAIIKIEEKNADRMLSYEEARENIKSYLFKKKADVRFFAWLEEKKQMTKIEYMIGVE